MRRFNHARLPLPPPFFLALNGTFQLVKWSPGELLVVGQWMSCTYIISFVCDHNTPSNTLKMGERLQSQKSYVCTFFDCKAKFSKSWKLEAHLCKHTGLVSAGAINRWGFCKNLLQIFVVCRCCFWGSHVGRFAVAAEALLLWELQQELLHPLPTHQTRAQPQRGKATQVSCSILFCDPQCWPFFLQLVAVLVFRCPAEGCPEAFVTHASMKNHMARIHCNQEKPYQVQKSCPLFHLFCFKA